MKPITSFPYSQSLFLWVKPLLRYVTCLLVAVFSFCSVRLFSQTTQTIHYTTREGLSSNSVYRTVLDKRGFLWIATENGLSRYDGRRFEIFTTASGLTDNEIIDLFTDSAGRVWAIPFRRSPCYYNPGANRFENASTQPALNKIDLANTHQVNVLEFGGVCFTNNQRELFIYKHDTVQVIRQFMAPKSLIPRKIIEYKPDHYLLVSDDSLRYLQDGKVVKQIAFRAHSQQMEYLHHTLYLVQENRVQKYAVSPQGDLTLLLSSEFPFGIRIFCNTGKNFSITSVNGNTYLLDTARLQISDIIYNKAEVRNVLEDADGNSWLSTMENGLIKIQQKRISSYTAIPEIQKNFNALLVKDGHIIAGTNSGELFLYDGLYNVRRIALTPERNIDAWVRKILPTPAGIYVSTQAGSFLYDNGLKKPIRSFTAAANHSSKTAVMLSDSILGLGTHAMAWKYNLRTEKSTDSITKRVISIAADRKGLVYIGSNDGLYRWDKDSLFSFGNIYKACTYRVNSMVCSPDNILWVGLGSDSLLALQDGNRIASLPLGDLIPGNICKSLYCNRNGEVWLGTNKGLNKINYTWKGGQFAFTNTYYGTADGLIGEQVNDITIVSDTVYVATTGGISYLPANLLLPVADIPSFITRVIINNRETELKDDYVLPYYRNNIIIEFSGVDLTGFVPLFEYSLNGRDWQRTEKIELVKLAPGDYKIRIRAIRRDGQPSTQEATLNIRIRTPFWNSIVFWVLVVLVSFAASIYFIQKRNRRKQKTAIAKVVTEKRIAELEMQALKAQINPHFVFNCLNSIKGFIYEKDWKQADLYLDKFSELLRSTMDNAEAAIITLQEEMKYLNTYLQLEKLRFGDKFDYKLSYSPGLRLDKLWVPAMLLQPYVENAIRHGVRHREDNGGMILVDIHEEDGYIVCRIVDNGVGREKAQRLKTENHVEYQSRGMQLSRRRAELYHIGQEVIDNKDDKGKAAGTTVVVRIPDTLKP